jgi:heme oxygenase
MAERGLAHAALHAGTKTEHERLDALFGGFSLTSADGYRAFLTAHARALPAIEQALDAGGFADRLADWPGRRRADALAADLVTLGGAVPAPLPAPALDTPAKQWGAAYVIEGSRLGGAMLARGVAADLPKAYLGTPQNPGNWRIFLDYLDKALTVPQDIAVAGETARAVFALFEAAGQQQMD